MNGTFAAGSSGLCFGFLASPAAGRLRCRASIILWKVLIVMAANFSVVIDGAIISVDKSKRAHRYVVSLVDRPDVPPLRISANKFRSQDELKEVVQAWMSLHCPRGEA